MLKKSMWYTIIGIAFAGLIVLGIGFYQAIIVTTMASPQSSPEAPINQRAEKTTLSSKKPNSIQLLILGDSVAKGTGDEKNKGFAGYLPEYFKNLTSKEVLVNNAGIDGLESHGLLEELQSQKLTQLLADSDIILVSIGGNDVRTILSLNTLAKEDEFKTRMDSYLANLSLIFQELRKVNPNSTLIFLGLYNPFEKLTSQEDVRLLNTWNYNTQQLVEEDAKAIFIPTHDLLKYNLERYIAQDNLHPNSAGYQAISSRISSSLETILTGF